MSGRKASEVSSLLRSCEMARKNSMDILLDSYNKAENTAKEFNCAKNNLLSCLKEVSESDMENIKREFPDVAKGFETEIIKITSDVPNDEGTFGDEDVKTYNRLINSYKTVDEEADKVRRDLTDRMARSSNGWYFDAEYKRADGVSAKYRSLSKEVSALNKRFNAKSAETAAKTAIANEKIKTAAELEKRIQAMDKKAKEVFKLRQEASLARNTVSDNFNSIDYAVAKKFLGDEYEELRAKVDGFLKLGDKDAVMRCKAVITDTEGYKGRFQVIYSAFLEKQGAAKAKMDSLYNRAQNKIFTHPTDEFKTDGKKEKINMLDFLSQYAHKKYVSEISLILDEISGFFDVEKFDELTTKAAEADNLINEALALAVRTHENRIKTIDTALKIKQAMFELGYDVRATKNENIDDGYCIECSVGDENIKFDRVTVVDDGKPVIDIFHKESVKGTCGKPWRTIRGKLAGEGVYIEDITKNGISINEETVVNKSKDTSKGLTANN